MSRGAFAPTAYGGTVTAGVGTGSFSSVGPGNVLRVVNLGAVPVFVSTGVGDPIETGVAIPPNTVEWISVSSTGTEPVEVWTLTSTAVVYISRGYLTP